MSEPQPRDYEVSTGKHSRWAAFCTWVSSVTSNGLIIALLVAGVGYIIQMRIITKQKQQQSYSELRGERAILPYLLYYYYQAFIHSDYHEARWKLTGAHPDSLDLQEGKRWMHSSTQRIAKA